MGKGRKGEGKGRERERERERERRGNGTVIRPMNTHTTNTMTIDEKDGMDGYGILSI